MEESTLNRILFSSQNPWVEQNRAPQHEGQAIPQRWRPGPDAANDQYSDWAGIYYSEQLDQTWELQLVDGALWLVPQGEAAQLLSPNGPDGLRMRGVNLWFARDSFLVSAVDEVTGDYIDGLWFERAV